MALNAHHRHHPIKKKKKRTEGKAIAWKGEKKTPALTKATDRSKADSTNSDTRDIMNCHGHRQDKNTRYDEIKKKKKDTEGWHRCKRQKKKE